jgi:hypothetical protein
MIFDSRLEIADAATLDTSGAATKNLTNVIDLGTNALNPTRDIGNGEPVYLVGTVDTDITSGGTATLQFQLASSANSTVETNGTQTVHVQTPVVTVPASANAATRTKAGSVICCLALPQGIDYKQYLTVQSVVGTAALTAGKVNFFLTADPTQWRAYSDFT